MVFWVVVQVMLQLLQVVVELVQVSVYNLLHALAGKIDIDIFC